MAIPYRTAKFKFANILKDDLIGMLTPPPNLRIPTNISSSMNDIAHYAVHKRVKVFHSDLLDQFRIEHNYPRGGSQVEAACGRNGK